MFARDARLMRRLNRSMHTALLPPMHGHPFNLPCRRGEIVQSLAGDTLRHSRAFSLLDDAVRGSAGLPSFSVSHPVLCLWKRLGAGMAASGSAPHLPLPPTLSMQMRAQLASVARPVRLVAGHNLFEEGDPADSFFVLQEGA